MCFCQQKVIKAQKMLDKYSNRTYYSHINTNRKEADERVLIQQKKDKFKNKSQTKRRCNRILRMFFRENPGIKRKIPLCHNKHRGIMNHSPITSITPIKS